MISFAVTTKLICVFVFAYTKSRFSHNEAHIVKLWVYRRLSQDQMQIFVSPEVIFQGCLSDFILWFLKYTDEAVSENVYISYNSLYCGIYFY